MHIKNYPHTLWTPEEVETLRRMFCENELISEIADKLGMGVERVQSKIRKMREAGESLPSRHRGFVPKHKRPAAAPPPPPPSFTMPDHMRYEDDPRAIGPGHPVYMPVRNTHYQSGGSSVLGGRYLGMSGKNGAV